MPTTEPSTKATTFTLVSKDASAPAVIKMWVKMNQRIRQYMQGGATLLEAVRQTELYYNLDWMDQPDDPKLLSALEIANEMEQYPARRLAD